MKKSFVPVLLLFAMSIQSANVMAMIKTARESQEFTPTKYWLNKGVKLEAPKNNAEAELKVLVTSREYRADDGEIKKTKNVKEVVRVIKKLQGQGANIYKSKYSKKGNTPLHTAVNNRRLAVVQALLQIAEDEGKLKEIISMGSKGELGKGKTPMQKAEKRVKIYKQIKDALKKAQEKIDEIEDKKRIEKEIARVEKITDEERYEAKLAMFNESDKFKAASDQKQDLNYSKASMDEQRKAFENVTMSKEAFGKSVEVFVDTLDFHMAKKLKSTLGSFSDDRTVEDDRLFSEYKKQLGTGSRLIMLTRELRERVLALKPQE